MVSDEPAPPKVPLEAFDCKDPDGRHTMWVWMENDNPLAKPHAAVFYSRGEAMKRVEEILSDGPPQSVAWIKLFDSLNENEQCYIWSRDGD